MEVASTHQATTPSAQRRRRRLSNFHIHGHTPKQLTPGPRRNSWTPARHLSRTPTKTPLITPSKTPRKTPSSFGRRSSVAPRVSSHTPRTSVGRGKPPPLSREEIAHMYSATIKLCQDNKINARNTWTLNLIDYMSMLVRTDTSDNQVARTVCFEDEAGHLSGNLPTGTNFQLAGVTLDAGVKIYCSRVDSVHTNAFKVLGGLSRSGNQDGSDADASGEPQEEAQEGDTRKQRRHGRRAGNVTLETNLGNITFQRLETDLAVDPLFQKMSAAFDEGGASGMLMNNLPIGPKAQIIFDSGETADYLVLTDDDGQQDDEDNSKHSTYDISKWLPEQPITEEDTICGPFLRYFESKQASLARRNKSPDNESGRHDANGASNDDSSIVEHNFGYDDSDLQDNSNIGMLPAPDVPFDVPESNDHDDVTLNVNDHSQEAMGGSMAIRRGSVDLVEAGVTLMENPDYSYFDTNALVGWAGPTHWSFRATSASTAAGNNDQKRTKKRTKKSRDSNAILLDFSLDAPEIDFASKFAPASRESLIQMSASVRNGFSEKKVTLPEDHHLSIQDLCSLFLRPNTFVKPNGSLASRMGQESDPSEGQNWYDFDNPGDKENFVVADANTMEDFSEDPFEESFEADDDVGMELLAEPTRVEKIDINYAKVAKKVDVRKLKAGIWTKLCGDSIDEDGGPDEGEDVYRRKIDSTPDSLPDVRTGASQRLQTIVSNVPSIVPPTSLPDVSLPYIFICLLHLANEKQLRITQMEDNSLTDLIVTADRQSGEE